MTAGLLLMLSVALLSGASERKSPADGGGRPAGQNSATQAKTTDAAQTVAPDGRGAQLFDTHCGRCHKPPDDLSPRVVPAVLSHMRTRAMLSREDEELILKFLNP
jgi:mono/diheme cytochrome c family protein